MLGENTPGRLSSDAGKREEVMIHVVRGDGDIH